MKELYVLRHAEKDAAGNVTEKGKNAARLLSTRIGQFELVYSSDAPRAVETAVMLTGKQPMIDTRAGAIPLSPEEVRIIHEQGTLHPFGIAGVLFESENYRPRIIEKGKELVSLIEELWDKLSDEGRALIISHDGVMVAADMILLRMELLKAQKTYGPLQGFCVFKNLSVEDLKQDEKKDFTYRR